MPEELSVATWNTAWRSVAAPAGRAAVSALRELSSHLLCLTEVDLRLADHLDGHRVDAGDGWGYTVAPTRRKVMLWSTEPWRDVVSSDDAIGMPSGRYVSGTTSTPLGDVRMVGVCVSWSHANVKNGRRDRKPWDEHRAHLAALEGQMSTELAHGLPLILAGDLNQRLDGSRHAPTDCRELLRRATQPLDVLTGTVTGARGSLIDHIAVHGLRPVAVEALDLNHGGRAISDHDGVLVRLVR